MMISRGIWYMFGAVFIFALMNVTVKFLQRLPGEEITLARCLVALVFSTLAARHTGASLLGTERRILFLRGFFGGAGMIAYFYALLLLPLASAVSIQYLSPVITTFFAARYLQERLTAWSWVFLFFSFAGVLLVKGFDPRVDTNGVLVALTSAVLSAGAYVNIGRLKGRESPYTIILYLNGIGAMLSLSLLLLRGSWVAPAPDEWLWLLGVGLLGQVAQDLMTRAYLSERASDVAIINYTGIFFALVLGWWLFGESYTSPVLAGMGLVLVGVFGNIVYHRREAHRLVEK